jgi:hypothetical protein
LLLALGLLLGEYFTTIHVIPAATPMIKAQ